MCLICERINLIKKGENPYFVKELNSGYVVIGDYQYFSGYALFLAKEHHSELFELPMDARLEFLKEMSIVAEAVSKAFGADKMNYELLGNADSHLHWHLFPRRKGDLDVPGPVWMLSKNIMFAEENKIGGKELEEMVHKLRQKLEEIQPTITITIIR
jgi:diadenosine tetraphosphate (Ap4A) HIT family hydrolase